MFAKKVPALYLFVVAAFSSIITYFAVTRVLLSGAQIDDKKSISEVDGSSYYKIQRDPRNFKYISPIISIDPVKESEYFSGVKQNIQSYIDEQKSKGSLYSASVYIKEFTSGNWATINSRESYNPGSLLKVGVLITYLRMAEIDRDLLKKEVVYHGQKGFIFPLEYYKGDTVVEGHKYKILELLNYMIEQSDNRATVFLEDHMDTTIFKKEFSDLGITEPRFNDPSYSLNVKEYSSMFKALYNAGYLRKTASENALAMLARSNFRNGLLRELPANLEVAHKFGESGNMETHELHESGIVYLRNNPYMITVMTKGKNWEKLSESVGHISKIVFDFMSGNAEAGASYHTTAAE